MDRKQARDLVEQYVVSWEMQDRTQFLETLHDEVVIRECDGPIYKGRDACKDWFRTWHGDSNRVLEWTIDSFLFDGDATMAAFEWDFKCLVDGEEYAFFGSSHVIFRDRRIYSINEYERTKDQYRP